MTLNSAFLQPIVLDLVETGGTIDMEGPESRRPLGTIDTLISAVEHFTPRVEIHRPLNRPVDSSNIGPSELKKIIGTVTALCEKRSNGYSAEANEAISGIVITHGTDTLQDTALLLALELADIGLSFPIILTCAYAPPTEPNSDALRNLVLAAVAAQSFRLSPNRVHVIPPGVYVVVGNDLHLASRIKKVTTRPIHNRSYVESYPAPVGQLTIAHKANLRRLDVENEVRIRIHQNLCCPKSATRTKRINKDEINFGYVEHLWFKKDSPVDILKCALERCHLQTIKNGFGAALVSHGDFSNKSDDELREIAKLVGEFRQGREQVPVFSGSPSVVTKLNRFSVRKKLIFLIPKSLSHSKARTKLSWLLHENLMPPELDRRLRQDIAGECYEIRVLPDWIAGESYGPNNHFDGKTAKRVVLVFPGIDISVYEESVESLLNSKSRKRELNIIGLGDGSIPLGPITVAEAVVSYLQERYAAEINLPTSAIYLDVESELSAHLKYNSNLRDIVAARYVIANHREMASEVIKWGIREEERAEELKAERKATSIVRMMTAELELSESKVRRIIQHSWMQELLIALKERMPESEILKRLCDVLKSHGFQTYSLPVDFSSERSDLSRFLVKHLEDWLHTIASDVNQTTLLVRSLSGVYARRLMKDAIAAYHPVLNEIVRCIDLGVRVNIKSNAEMAQTDTRTYELGNFLLVAGVNSAEVRGWPAGPLRLKSAKPMS